MPAKPAWLLHVPAILCQLEAFDVPVVDRAAIEQLFGLRRRRAIELMHAFGGYQAGRTFLISRRSLIDRLQQLKEGDDFRSEHVRRERLDEVMERLRRHRAAAAVRIPVPEDVFSRRMSDLPAGVAFGAGRLCIEFSGTEDLLGKLFALAQAAANDYGRFQQIAEEEAR